VLTVAVLGAVEARRDGTPVPVPTGKTTELLVRLALEAGTRVRADTLLDDLWSGPVGRNTLQSKVSQLRRALGDPALVVGSGDGYTLAVDPSRVDAVRAVELAAAASAARSRADPVAAAAKAQEGLALVRGDVLAEWGDWVLPHRVRLEEVRLGLLEDAMSARVDLGSGGELVGTLEALVEQHPLREGLWAALIRALYRAGRQADALAAYTRVRAVLVEELGIEPGAGLRELEQQVLQHSPALDRDPSPPRRTGPGNLPPAGTPLVGRAGDASAVHALVAGHRLVTVVGPAGVGKTRLALEVARACDPPGGVWLVRLDAVRPTVGLTQVVAETLHVPGGERSLVERLAGAETLLVLDNCEHLVADVGGFVVAMTAAVPGLRVLATSQVPLGVDGERVHPLEPLSGEDSVALFTTRAREMRRQLVLDAEATALVEELCSALDGLPLAIELAAARVRSLSVRDIARRLDDRFVLLQDPTSHRPARSRALVSAIGWSYDLLFPDDQRGLWALSVFSGTASLDAVEHVLVALGVPAPAVLDTIGRLVDRSLVGLDVADDGSVRYRLLDSIRAYAADRLGEAGQGDVAAAAHADWYVGAAAWCDAHVRSGRQPECVTLARAERADVDAALAWCAHHDPAAGVRVALGFGWTWVVLGDGTAGAARVRGALTPTTPDRDRAAGLLLAGWLEASAGDLALASEDLGTARTLAGTLDDDLLRADVRRHWAFLAIQQGRPHDVLACAEAALATYRPLELVWPTACCLVLAAYGALMLGDTGTATRHATEALDALVPLGDAWGLVHAQAMLGGIAQAEHRLEDAATALAEAAEQSRRLGFTGQAALHLASLGRVQQRARDDRAAATFDRAITAALACGDGRLAAGTRLNLARLNRTRGNDVAARALLAENQRWYGAAGGGEGALLNRCLLHATSADTEALKTVLDEAVAEGSAEVQVYALDALARAAADGGDHERAAGLLATADALAAGVTHLVDEADRHDKAQVGQPASP
jgi:predicted ATPase/DNA-binding SARP family transcriptional activator